MKTFLVDLGLDPAWIVKAVFETNLLLLFCICFWHSLRTHGVGRTFREFSAGFLLTALAESAGVLSGAYVYPGFHFYVLATPVGNPASWVALVYVVMTISERLVFGRPSMTSGFRVDEGTAAALRPRGGLVGAIVLLALCDASLALLIDLVLDPLATVYNWWIWVPSEAGVATIGAGVVDPYNFDRLVWMKTPPNSVADFFARFFVGGWRYPTRVLGIPLINFIAWFVFVFVFSLQFRWIDSRRHWTEWRRTGVLWAIVLVDVPILALLLISPNL